MSTTNVKPVRPFSLPLALPESAKVGEIEIKLYNLGGEFKAQMAMRGHRALLIESVKRLLVQLEQQPDGQVVLVK